MIAVACATLCAEGFENSFFAKTFAMIPAAGFRFLEINAWFPELLAAEHVASLRERAARHDLTPVAVLGPSWRARPLAEDLRDKTALLHYTRQVGADLFIATGQGRGRAGGIDAVIEELRELLPVARDLGLRLGLENHQGNEIETLDDYRRVFAAIDDPRVGAVADNGHFDASGIRSADVVEALADRVLHLHLKENNGFGRKSFVRFGEGTTDHHAFIQGFLDRGYEGYLTVEISPPGDRPVSIADLTRARELFERYARP